MKYLPASLPVQLLWPVTCKPLRINPRAQMLVATHLVSYDWVRGIFKQKMLPVNMLIVRYNMYRRPWWIRCSVIFSECVRVAKDVYVGGPTVSRFCLCPRTIPK